MKLSNIDQKYRILVIDDNVAIHEDFRKILMKPTRKNSELEVMETLLFGTKTPELNISMFQIDCVSQGQEGVEMAKRAEEDGCPYSLAFVDGRMPPGWDGIETINHLWNVCPNLQVVLCTAYADYSWPEIRAVLGESDSLLILKKPFDNVEVLQLAHALTRKWELNREVMGRLNQLSYFDHLTGLPNRITFIDLLSQAIESGRRYQHKGALLFIDLDNFKRINDTLGHNVGDELIKKMAERLVVSVRVSDTVSRSIIVETAARLGGDEFTVILSRITHSEDAAIVARRIEQYIEQPVIIGGNEFTITASIGIALFEDDGRSVEELLSNAELAMYSAKSVGLGRYNYFKACMNDVAQKRLTIETQLRHAIKQEELTLNYQPQIDLRTGEVVGFEALLRWNNKQLGSVPPLELIPVAEASGLILAIGEWVLRQACMQFQSWIEQGLPVGRIAVNVSIKQFTHPDFVKMVSDILTETKLAPNCLEIEITESLLALDSQHIASILHELRNNKILIAVDDFGTGYSSLSRLKDMPIDCLKIDRSFICGIDQESNDRSIIEAILAMADGMGLRVVAEGVDSMSQVDFLKKSNCPEVQGYLFSVPLPAEEVGLFFENMTTVLAL
ncbi:MAG: EAL domain-containing protein [Desulfotalea sp.]